MKINSVKLKNIGPYKNETFFTFETDKNKNIVLIGGKNGSGKTTLLNSLKFGLFGNYALGLKSESLTYINAIKKMLNYEKVNSTAYIQIDFDLLIHNNMENIVLKRQWLNINSRFHEEVYIKKNNQPLDEIETEILSQQMKHAITPDLLKSFIYDGERISQDIEQGTISNYLNEVFESAFNLNVFSSLTKDLDTFLSKKSNETKSESELYLFTISRDISKIKENIKSAKSELGMLESKQTELTSKLNSLEKEIRVSGGLTKNDYEAILFENEALVKNKDQKDRDMKLYIEYELPKFIARDLIYKGLEQAKSEKTLQLAQLISTVNFELSTDLSALTRELELKNSGKKLIHNIDYQLITHIEKQMDIIKNKNLKYKKYISSRDKEIETINESIIKINRANSEQVKLLLDQKELIQNNLVFTSNDILSKQKKIDELESRLNATIQYYELETQKLMKSQMANTSFLVGQRALDITNKIKQNLIAKKLEDVSKLTLHTFNRTIRKKNTVLNLVIDTDFNIHLFDQSNHEFGISVFSAGEKQLLISSIIFSIFKVSKKSNLFIFDTPLARLDQENRKLFINNIIKEISDQVIVLSTDSEFVGEYYKEINSNIKSEYLLKYLDESNETRVLNEYFEVKK